MLWDGFSGSKIIYCPISETFNVILISVVSLCVLDKVLSISGYPSLLVDEDDFGFSPFCLHLLKAGTMVCHQARLLGFCAIWTITLPTESFSSLTNF